MESGDAVQVVALLAALGGFFLFILVTINKNKARAKKFNDEERKKVEHGVKRGICDEQGMPLCLVCKELGEDVEATEFTPITGRSWWDSLAFVRKARELWAQPDRDIVVDDVARGPRLCMNHKKMAVRKLSEVHAGCRSDAASFNADQREKIDYMDSGGTEAMIVSASKKIREALGYEDPLAGISQLQLHSSTESIALPVSSSNEPIGDPDE